MPATSVWKVMGLAMLLVISVVSGTPAVPRCAGRVPGRLDVAFASAMGVVVRQGGESRSADPGAGPAVARERWLAGDKLRHAGYSLAGTLVGASVLKSLGMAAADSPRWAGVSILSLGVFKEVAMDGGREPSTASWRDFAADLLGVIAGWIFWETVRSA